MGSTVGSILQTVGQTGNEVGAANEANINQSHQFMMDYLANQARSRGLDIAQTGQQNALSIARGQQSIEQQRLDQSKWQLMPGYDRVPDPDNPTKTLYRHTFVSPITKQKTYFDMDQPPPNSPEYNMNTFKFMRDQAKENNIDLPINTLLSISGMKVDTPSDINNKYQTYWQQLNNEASKDPAAKASLNKNFPGGYIDFFTQMIKGEHVGFSKEEWDNYVMNNHLTQQGNQPTNPYNKMYEDSLVKSQTAYEKMFKDANDSINKLGAIGSFTQPDVYKSAISSRDEALNNLNQTKDALSKFRTSNSTPSTPAAATPPSQTSVTNPPMAQDVALSHGATGRAKAKADGNWYWHDAKGDIIGPAPAGGQ